MLKAVLQSSIATTNAVQDTSTTGSLAQLDGNYYHDLYFEWTPGVTSNVLTIKVYTRVDTAGQWTQDMEWADASGTLTRTLRQIQHTALSTAVVPLWYQLGKQAEQIKVTFVESDAGGAGKGTFVCTLFSRVT